MQLIHTLALIFITASIISLLFEQLNHPIIPAYILTGIIIGSQIPEEQLLNASQIGISFLIFVFGIKTDFTRLKTVYKESISTAAIQLTLLSAAGFVFAQGLGINLYNSIIISAAAAFSSSLIGLELIQSEIKLDIIHGRLAETIQLIQDLVALLLIGLLGIQLTPTNTALKLGSLAAILGSALFVRYFLFDKIAYKIGESRELLTLSSISLLTVFLGISQSLNISIVIGAFAAGLAVAKFPENLEILDTMSSFKDFFSALFFVSLGALLSIPSSTALTITIFLLAATLLVKPVITGLSLMISGYDKRTSYLAGFSLDQISEFSLIIVIQAFIAGAITSEVFHGVILAATVSMILSSYTSRYEEEIYSTITKISLVEATAQKIQQKSSKPDKLEEHAVILGYDTEGELIAEKLEEIGEEFVLIENDPDKIEKASKEDYNYIFGDAMDSETWEKAQVDKASIIVSTAPFRYISEQVLGLETDATIILRSETVEEASYLLEEGADYVSVPDLMAAEELIDHIKAGEADPSYRDELRRRNLLEVRKKLQDND
ncbi:MAG: cation:proton antiporter [Candidatus Nanohaloarchaea archaeon]